MAFKSLTSGEVKKIINSLRANTSSGANDIPTAGIIILETVLSGPLGILINEHIRSGIFSIFFHITKTIRNHLTHN